MRPDPASTGPSASSAGLPALAPPGGAARAPSRSRRGALVGLVGAAALLAGCGGGVYLTVPIGEVDNGPPLVQISPLPSFVQPNGVLTLGAGVAGGNGTVQVAFYRIDGAFGTTATYLGADNVPPYQLSTLIPADGRTSVSYYAEAQDRFGYVVRSAVVSAPVFP